MCVSKEYAKKLIPAVCNMVIWCSKFPYIKIVHNSLLLVLDPGLILKLYASVLDKTFFLEVMFIAQFVQSPNGYILRHFTICYVSKANNLDINK